MRDSRSHPAGPGLPELDQATADLLLDGTGDRPPANPEYAALLAVLEAARGPATAAELRAQGAVVTAFRAQHRHRQPARRPGVLTKLLTLKAAVAAVGAVSVVSVTTVATNHLTSGGPPAGNAHRQADQAAAAPAGELDRVARVALCEALAKRTDGSSEVEQRPASAALAKLAGGPEKVAAFCANVAATSSPPGASAAGGTGPDATGPAGLGLCRAYQAGRGVEQGNKATAVAFQALAEAAGGQDRIASYCQARLAAAAAHRPAAGRPTATPTRHGPTATPSHPRPADPGQPAHPTRPAHPAPPSHPQPAPTPTPAG